MTMLMWISHINITKRHQIKNLHACLLTERYIKIYDYFYRYVRALRVSTNDYESLINIDIIYII
jgi:hypothetical protein